MNNIKRFQEIFPPFVLAAAVLLLFFRTLSFGFVNLDDDRHVYENTSIRSFKTENWVRWFTQPVVSLYVPMVSYAVDYRISGNKPWGWPPRYAKIIVAAFVLGDIQKKIASAKI